MFNIFEHPKHHCFHDNVLTLFILYFLYTCCTLQYASFRQCWIILNLFDQFICRNREYVLLFIVKMHIYFWLDRFFELYLVSCVVYVLFGFVWIAVLQFNRVFLFILYFELFADHWAAANMVSVCYYLDSCIFNVVDLLCVQYTFSHVELNTRNI